jgi:hypothetical protein
MQQNETQVFTEFKITGNESLRVRLDKLPLGKKGFRLYLDFTKNGIVESESGVDGVYDTFEEAYKVYLGCINEILPERIKGLRDYAEKYGEGWKDRFTIDWGIEL